MLIAFRGQHAEFSKDGVIGELSRAAPFQLVPLDEETSHAVADMTIDAAIRRQAGPITLQIGSTP